MSTITDRLDVYLRHLGLSDTQLATIINIDVNIIRQAREENRDFPVDVYFLITQHFKDLNKEWLLLGKGEMLNMPPPKHISVGENYLNMSNGAVVNNSFNNEAMQHICDKLLQEMADMRTDFCKVCEGLHSEKIEIFEFLKKIIDKKQ